MNSMSHKEYPDFNRLEQMLIGNVFNIYPELREKAYLYNICTEMFPQTWGSTAGGFEEPGMYSGQEMITEYTTVMKLTLILRTVRGNMSDTTSRVFYGVFFGNKPAYMVEEPIKGAFFKDLKNHTIKSKYEAKKKY